MHHSDVQHLVKTPRTPLQTVKTLRLALGAAGLYLALSLTACTSKPPPPPPPPPPPAKNPLPPLPQPEQIDQIDPKADPSALPRAPKES